MTDRSSEERSRFEKWATGRFSLDTFARGGGPEDYADPETCRALNIWRAALEDRQEAAPEVGLRIDNLINYADSLQSDTIYLDPNDIAFIHEYYGCKTGCCTKFAGKLMKPKVGVVPGALSEADTAKFDRAEKEVARGEVHKLSELSGVPSEATPSKENAELKYENERLMGCVDSSHRQLASTRAYLDREGVAVQSFWVIEQFKDGIGGKYWAGDSSRDFVDDIEKAVQYRRKSDAWRATRGWHWTDIKHTEHLILPPAGTPAKEAQTKCSYCGWGTGHAEKCPAPAPEVQGTPAKECICPTETWTVDGSDMHDSMCEIDHDSPVGTPQKETPPVCGDCKYAAKARPDDPKCYRHKAAPVPEGVQGKEPQTPTAQELAKGHCTDMIATLQANVREGKETPPSKCNCGSHKLAPLYHRPDCPASQTAPIPQASTSEAMTVRLGRAATFAEKEYSRGFHEGHALGEAAGRRSAITEIQERAYEEARAGNQIHAKDVAEWCAELQEKTK